MLTFFHHGIPKSQSYDIIYSQNSEKIFIGGLGNVSHNLDNLDKTMEYFNSSNIDYKVMLVHEPDISDLIIDNNDVNLILAGHSHNGQIRLPIIGKIYTPNGSKKYYEEHISDELSVKHILIAPEANDDATAEDKTKAEKWNIQTILGIASSVGSLGLTAASLANILK